MNTMSVSRGMVSKLQKALLALVAVMVLFGSLPTKPAHAWTLGVQRGRPGSVRIPNIYIGDLLMPYGLTQFTLYASTGPLVYRSPATSGDQLVGAKYIVEKWNGSDWVMTAQTGTFVRTIAAGQTAKRFPAPYIQPIRARGYFRVTYLFTWSTANGVFLGAASVEGNLRSDHVCVTPYRLCRSFPGYFRTGGQGTGTW